MKPVLAAFVALAVLPLAACGGSGAEEEWAGPPKPGDGGSLSVGPFNDYLEEYAEYAGSPVTAATEFLRLDRTGAATTSLVARREGEQASPARVTVTLDRLLDDSVRAQRYDLVLDLAGEDTWKLVSGVATQRCWPGRGHQTFSTDPCV